MLDTPGMGSVTPRGRGNGFDCPRSLFAGISEPLRSHARLTTSATTTSLLLGSTSPNIRLDDNDGGRSAGAQACPVISDVRISELFAGFSAFLPGCRIVIGVLLRSLSPQ